MPKGAAEPELKYVVQSLCLALRDAGFGDKHADINGGDVVDIMSDYFPMLEKGAK